jgi:hypothetical protein
MYSLTYRLRSFSFVLKHTPVLRTPNMSRPSTYKRNNIKEISNLPVDFWKIADLFLSLNFTYSFSTYTSTSPHHVNSHPPRTKQHHNNKTTKRKNHHITTTNNKTQKPSHALPSNGEHSQNSSRQ